MNQIKQNPLYRKFVNWLNTHYPIFVAKFRFKKMFGKPLDLENPKDLNEKILWLSLFSDISEWSRLADKYAVRQYVSDVAGKGILTKLYGKWDKAENIDWESLPNQFVLKTNNGSGTVKIVHDKSKLDISQTIKLMNEWLGMKVAPSTTEFHYAGIKPCIIAEELIDFSEDINDSSSIIDYKFWCFNGKPKYVFTCSNRNEMDDSIEISLYDTNWNDKSEMLNYTKQCLKQRRPLMKPKSLNEMIHVAEKLAQPFPIVRVDLYSIEERIYFGEMTFTSLGGTMNYFSSKALMEMGNLVDISQVKKVRNF